MRGRGMACRELEEVLPDQEGAADVPTEQPQQPLTQEEAANTQEDRSEPTPPSVEPADTPVARMRWKILKFMRTRQLGGNHPYWWTLPYW